MTVAGQGDEPPFLLEGTVLRRSSSGAWVDTDRGVLSCSLRGKLRHSAPVVAGDRVRVLPAGPGEGALEEVLPRRSELQRGGLTGETEGKITAANIDRVAVVISAAEPPPRWALVDRLLVEADRQGLGRVVVVNKMDLLVEGSSPARELEEAFAIYRSAGVELFPVSAGARMGLNALVEALGVGVSVLSGHSGVGKTSLLNALIPGQELPTGLVNDVTGKGRHTTSSAVLMRLPAGGYLMDTPGFREFTLEGVAPQELGRYYPEFEERLPSCRFKDCLHQDDPDCGVRSAVEGGAISSLRYRNYLQILRNLQERPPAWAPRRFARKKP